jgi:predicted dehydrogenase
MPAMRQRVLVVGAGKRVQETVLPALICLGGDVEIAGVWSRTARKLELYGGEFTVQTESGPGAYDLSQIDTIIAAVTRSQVPSVLRSLSGFDTGHIALMLDTPVLDVGHLGATRMFKRFARVVCSEDSIALPPIATAKRLIDEGAIGALRSVQLFHSGWRNHALAAVRFLAGMRTPSRITVRQWNQKWSETRFRFPGGIRAGVVQPHVHGNGRVLVVGDRGAIVDYVTDRSDATEIGYLVEDGFYRGVTVNGEPVDSELDRRLHETLPRHGLPNPTLDNMFKIRGFMELVRAVHDETSPFSYEAFDAIYDHQSMRLAERLPAFVDVRLGGKRSLFTAGLRAATRLTRG